MKIMRLAEKSFVLYIILDFCLMHVCVYALALGLFAMILCENNCFRYFFISSYTFNISIHLGSFMALLLCQVL